MTKKTEDYIVKGSIVLFFILYMSGYAWMIESEKTKTEKIGERMTEVSGRQPMQVHSQQTRTEKEHQVKSLSDWPLDLGKYSTCTVEKMTVD